MTIYTGSGTVVAPAGAISCSVEAWGGGGSYIVGTSVFAGGGGAYAGNLLLSVSGGNTLTYNAASVGGASQDSWVSTTGVRPTTSLQGVLAVGGSNGGAISGLGGLASASIGTVKFSGGNGDGSTTFVGGGGAGSGGNGQSGSAPTYGAGGFPDGGPGSSGGDLTLSSPGGGAAPSSLKGIGGTGQVRIVFFFFVQLSGKVRIRLNGASLIQKLLPGVKQYSYTQNLPVAVSQQSFSTQISAALASVQSALSAIPVLRDATLVQLAPVILAASSALAKFASIRATIDAQLSTTSVGGIVPGLPAPQIVSTYLQQLTAIEQLNTLVNAEAYLGRILTNLGQATG